MEGNKMKKQYNGMQAEKVEFDYEENVVASNPPSNPSCWCGHWEGNMEIFNKKNSKKCFNPCKWVMDR